MMAIHYLMKSQYLDQGPIRLWAIEMVIDSIADTIDWEKEQ